MELEEIDLEIYDLKMRLHDLGRELDTRELYGIGDAIGDAFNFVDRAGYLLSCHMGYCEDDIDEFEITGKKARED